MYEAGAQGFKTEAARCAALIRAELRKHGIQATVRSKNFSMGNSVDVDLLGDPLPATVQKVEAFCKNLQDGHFDGMTDCYHYAHHDDNLPRAKYVHVSVRYSDAIRAEARAYLDEYWGDSRADWQRDQDVWPCLNGTLGHFWTARKPRMRVAA